MWIGHLLLKRNALTYLVPLAVSLSQAVADEVQEMRLQHGRALVSFSQSGRAVGIEMAQPRFTDALLRLSHELISDEITIFSIHATMKNRNTYQGTFEDLIKEPELKRLLKGQKLLIMDMCEAAIGTAGCPPPVETFATSFNIPTIGAYHDIGALIIQKDKSDADKPHYAKDYVLALPTGERYDLSYETLSTLLIQPSAVFHFDRLSANTLQARGVSRAAPRELDTCRKVLEQIGVNPFPR